VSAAADNPSDARPIGAGVCSPEPGRVRPFELEAASKGF